MQLIDSIRTIIDQELFALGPEIGDDDDLYAEGLDSMALMQLILILEREFSITITPEDLSRGNFATLTNLTAFVAGKQTTAT
jgi:acyl carrier protein